MLRTVVLSPHPSGFHYPKGLIVTPNPRAAEAFEAKFTSLDRLARKVLQEAGLLVASEIVAYRTLMQAVAEVIDPQDVPGTTRLLQGAVRELLRAGLSKPARLPGKVAALLELSARYRALLDAAKLVDPAEVTARAAAMSPARLVVQVRGYPRLGWSEFDFLDAIADKGSLLVLPVQASGLFSGNEESAAYLTG
ncbi:MAG: hypothetical protein KGZ60_07145 [Truepera sp.]|nr:hypothetical protein [Truepera sp.]